MICASCGKRIEPGSAYGDLKGNGPWHRLCIPPDPNSWEQMVARAAELEARGKPFPARGENGGAERDAHLRGVK